MTDKILKINTGQYVAEVLVYNLVPEHDPLLHTPCIPFDFSNPPVVPIQLTVSLFETMFKNRGIGLSANQVGVPYSVFVCGTDNQNKQIFFNPQIIEHSEDEEKGEEGCLSFPQLILKIKRYTWIKVRYNHVDGREMETRFDGLTARIIAHEIDHLNGITFTDKLPKLSLKMALEKRHKLQKKLSRKK